MRSTLVLIALFLSAPALAGQPGPDTPVPQLSLEEYMAQPFAPAELTDEDALNNPYPVYPADSAAPSPPPSLQDNLSEMVLQADDRLLLLWLRAGKNIPLEHLNPVALAKIQRVLQIHLEPIEADTDTRTLTFGAEGRITCIPSRSTDIRLAPDEVITAYWFGDPQRWQSATATEAHTRIPHLIIRPSDWALQTNLIIVTTRRTYALELEVPSAAKKAAFDATVSYFYPDDWTRHVQSAQQQQALQVLPATDTTTRLETDPSQLNFAYRLEPPRKKKHRLAWRPSTVFDDGARVWIGIPAGPTLDELPALLGVDSATGTTTPLNVHREGQWLVVHRLFREARLASGNRYLDIERAAQ